MYPSPEGRIAAFIRVTHGRVRRQLRHLTWCAAAASLLGAGTAQATSSGPVARPTLSAASTFVVFNQHARLSGTASATSVTLLARHFGQSAFRRVATARVHAGRFTFSPVPILATSYEVSAGAHSPVSRAVTVYVHLDVVHFRCSLCRPPQPAVQRHLRYSLTVRVPAADDRFVLSEPVYLYVGTSAGKIASERRVGRASPRRDGRSTVKVSGSVTVDVPAGWRVRFTACDRSEERRTGVGLPSVHDCGEARLNHRQFTHYVG